MIARVYNWVKSFGEIPIVKRFIPKKTNKNLELSKKIYLKNQNLTLESENKTLSVSVVREVLNRNNADSVLAKKFPEFNEKIQSVLSKTSPTTPVEFKEKNLSYIIQEYQDKLNTRFEEELNKLNNQKFDQTSHIRYLELWQNYLIESKRLIIEVTDSLLFNTLKLSDVNDIDLMIALQVSRELSKQIARNSLNQITDEIKNIPIGYEVDLDGKKISLRESIKNTYKEDYINLFLVSNFGMFSNDIITSIVSMQEKSCNKHGKELFENFSTISKFQQAIQGSLLQNRSNLESNEHEIGMINPKIVQDAFERLTNLYNKFVKMKATLMSQENYNEQKNIILGEIKDIKQFIYELGVIENTELNILRSIKNNNILETLDIDLKESTEKIYSAYQNINQISNNLGTLQDEEIMGITFNKTPIINMFNMEIEQSIDHFERIILEVSILAGMKVILSEEINPKYKNLDLSVTKKNINNQILPATKNFESIPWLKNFYKDKVEYFENLVKNENSAFKIGPVIKELSNIGRELHRSKLFTASDFFTRYGLDKLEEELLSIIGDMTDIGKMSLNIEFVTHFLSYINHEQNCPMTKEEIINIKLLINFLNEKSKVYDEKGNQIYAPLARDQRLKEAYEKTKEMVGKREFLALNAPLIIKFLKTCYGQDTKPPRKILDDSFEANNQVLASWLFYIIVKFLPEKSLSNDSLKVRMNIAEIIMNQEFQNGNRINPSLYKKMTKQTRGLSELGNFPSKRGRQGVIKGLCKDLEENIKLHISEKTKNIPLKELLLHYAKLEDIFKTNPKSYNKIVDVQKNIFKTNEDLLEPLENHLINLYTKESATVIEFVKSKKQIEPKYFDKLAIDLLNKITEQLNRVKLNDPIILIKESSEDQIKLFKNIIEDIINLGYLLKENSNNELVLSPNMFKMKKPEDKIEDKINKIYQFMKKKISIKEEMNSQEKEVFPNQYQIIKNLRILLNNLNLHYQVELKDIERLDTEHQLQAA